MRLVVLLIFVIASHEAYPEDIPTLHVTCASVEKGVSETNYSIGWHDHDSLGALVLQVATRAADVAGDPVIRLVCKLSRDFPKERVIHAWIFDNKTAALNGALVAEDQKRHGEYLWHLRGHYELNRDEKIEYIEYLVPIYRDNLFQVLRAKVILSP